VREPRRWHSDAHRRHAVAARRGQCAGTPPSRDSEKGISRSVDRSIPISMVNHTLGYGQMAVQTRTRLSRQAWVQAALEAIAEGARGRSGGAARQATRCHEGQLLLALPQPRGARRGRARRLGALAHRRRDRGDRGLVGRPAPAASPPLHASDRTGRTRPDRTRAPRNRRSPHGAAGARPRHTPAHRVRRPTLPAARLLTRRGEATARRGASAIPARSVASFAGRRSGAGTV
jgi:hypothetical protein